MNNFHHLCSSVCCELQNKKYSSTDKVYSLATIITGFPFTMKCTMYNKKLKSLEFDLLLHNDMTSYNLERIQASGS